MTQGNLNPTFEGDRMTKFQRVELLEHPPVVGRAYSVFCLLTPEPGRILWGDWIPLFGPGHVDSPPIDGGDRFHFGIDFRFTHPATVLMLKIQRKKLPLGALVIEWQAGESKADYRNLVCWASDFPGWDAAYKWHPALEEKYATAKLGDCMTCPHQNAPLSSVRIKDGYRECPHHGLRWGQDGRLVPRAN